MSAFRPKPNEASSSNYTQAAKNLVQYTEQESRDLYDILLEGNRNFCQEITEHDPSFFKNLAKGQHPDYLLIGCSDSRVPPGQLTKTKPGQMFIHRNVANMVVNTDTNFMSVLQYAVEVLRVKHVIVMGHYGCGGVKAAMTNQPHGLIDKWLRNIKDVIRMHRQELGTIADADTRFRRLVELNVEEQVFNIYKTTVIQEAWAAGDRVQVHGWVCDIETGLIKDLKIEQSKLWHEIEHIYEFDYTGGVVADITYGLCPNANSIINDELLDIPTPLKKTPQLRSNSEPVQTENLQHPLRQMRCSFSMLEEEHVTTFST